MQVRFARHTDRLAEIVRFYRDGLGLRELGRFEDHDGYDGIFLALAGTETQLEFTTGGERVGAQPVEPANPYWRARGVTLVDPDGFRVVLVPDSWVAD